MSRTATAHRVDSTELEDLTDHVDADDAAAVLWHFGGPGGRQPGQFTAQLLQALAHADPGNRALLAQVYPGVSRAFTVAAQEPFGLELLAQIAQGGA